MTKELIERITQAREHTQLYGQVLPALWVYQPFTMNAGELFSAIEALQARVVELGDELERERICHAACGVIALSNTPESAATMRQMKDEYRSASVQDVCNAVDREMALRVERDSLAAELAAALPYGPRPKFGAIGSRDVDVAEAQRAWDKAMAAQPAQMQINCDDCVYHYKDADQKPCAMCIHGTGLYDNFEPRIPAAQGVK